MELEEVLLKVSMELLVELLLEKVQELVDLQVELSVNEVELRLLHLYVLLQQPKNHQRDLYIREHTCTCQLIP